MKTARLLLVAVCLASIMVPFAYSIFFIGPTMFIATNGGITTFAENFTATSLTYPDGLNRFTNLGWGGNLRGNFGVDADTGVNVSVTAINRDTVTYTVTTAAPGAVTSYIYYYKQSVPHLSEPASVTGGTYTYDPITHIVNVTTTVSPMTVVVEYNVGPGVQPIEHTIDLLISLLPLVALVTVLEAKRYNLVNNKILILVLLVAAISIVLMTYRYFGY